MHADSPSAEHRPATPDSLMASSLDHATHTIDDLTLALASFSRVPSPEPQRQISCCCGSEECEATIAWLALKSKLENRLVLSAEVGSALLQRHEAYVRRHQPDGLALRKATQDSSSAEAETDRVEGDAKVTALLKQNALLEKQLTQALLHSEVVESSNKTLLNELEEARDTVSRLSAHHARAVGLDAKLSAVLQENDDIRQERDSQSQRAKLAEARLAALKGRTDKLQAEVRRLQDDLESRRLRRLESSESLLQDVRSKLEGLQTSRITKSVAEDANPEVIKVIESLVVDNQTLKADNEKLHKLLTESREDLQALQTEVGEQSIAPPIRVETPSKHSLTFSGVASSAKDSFIGSMKRPSSAESQSRRAYEPLTPETGRRPLSPADSLMASPSKCNSVVHPRPQYPPSQLSLDMDNEPEYDQAMLHPNQSTKAVQTDGWPKLHSITGQTPPFYSDHSSTSVHDGSSESSSLFDGIGSPLSSLLERMHYLLRRMTQADALTLTNRLKRQHLRGADVKHLSRTTIGNILSDVSHLRVQYRVWLEDDKITTSCTRKDLRGLFKLFREVLEEMGQMRVTLNDVILEPAVATRVSEMALDPSKAEAMEKERKASGIGSGVNWMAPFSKLFSSSSYDTGLQPPMRAPPRLTGVGQGNIRTSRLVPKIGPALAASATTVNVEFSGIGAGKSVTSIFSAHPDNEPVGPHVSNLHTIPHPSASTQTNTRSIMDIFAGAPHLDDTSEPWVVLPRAPRRVQSTYLPAKLAETGTATVGRSAVRKRNSSQLVSRDVDAVVDVPSISNRGIGDSEADDIHGPLLERALRRRGLSDSSIHSTFMNQSDRNEGGTPPAELAGHRLERTSVLRTLTRTVQSFKQVTSHKISGVVHSPSTPAGSQVATSDTVSRPPDIDHPAPIGSSNNSHSQPPRVPTPTLTSLIPSLTSWAAAGAALDSAHTRGITGSLWDDAGVPRLFGREGQGRDI